MNTTTCPGSDILGLGLTRSQTKDECLYCGKMFRINPYTSTIQPHEGATR